MFARISVPSPRGLLVFVTIQTPAAMAHDLRREHPALAATYRLLQIVSELGLRLEAMHPDTSDTELASQFYVSAPNARTAAEVRRRIEEAGVVDAVYVKPPEGPPSG
jgi:hypothetical protein